MRSLLKRRHGNWQQRKALDSVRRESARLRLLSDVKEGGEYILRTVGDLFIGEPTKWSDDKFLSKMTPKIGM